jgi:hypothetical protein
MGEIFFVSHSEQVRRKMCKTVHRARRPERADGRVKDDVTAASGERTSMSADRCSNEYWLGPGEVKYSSSGVERSVRPSATIRRALAVLDTIGVTKVADVTDLDRIGIPNFMTVRPHDPGPGISYYNGKGTTRADAYAGALMEAIERHAGELPGISFLPNEPEQVDGRAARAIGGPMLDSLLGFSGGTIPSEVPRLSDFEFDDVCINQPKTIAVHLAGLNIQ